MFEPTGSIVDHDPIRSFDLVSTQALDDRAVEDLAQALLDAALAASDALGSVTRRNSELVLGDTLDPTELPAVLNDPGAKFMVLDPRENDRVLGLLHLSETDAVALADLFLGGPGSGSDRRLTEIEAFAIGRLGGEVFAPIVGAATYRTPGPIRLVESADPSGLDPQLVRLEITMTTGAESIVAALYVANPDETGQSGGGESRKLVTASVATMPIDIDIDLAAVDMAASDISALETGDVVLFDVPTTAPAVASHGRHNLLEGRITDTGGRRLFEVVKVPSD